MTLGLKKPAIETILRAYVADNYPGFEVQSMSFVCSMSGGDYRDSGSPIFTDVSITLKQKAQR
jgi:hypothetical protein